jgi:hypothetical protein
MPSDLTNNSAQTARAILIGGQTPFTTVGSLSSATGGDTIDYYKFTTSAVSNLNVSIGGLTGNARLKVFRQGAGGAEGVELINNLIPGNTTSSSSLNSGQLSESFVFNGLAAGAYLIRLDLDTGATATDYGLQALASTDGKVSSIMWRAPGTDPLYFWKMNGSSYQETLGSLSGFEIVGTGDFDGDKTTDLVFRQTTTAPESLFVIWLMNPDNTRKSGGLVNLPGQTSGAAFSSSIVLNSVQDFDGDGKSDLIFRNTTPGAEYAYFWRMNGLTTRDAFARTDSFLNGYDIAGSGDFDGNGTKDMVWRNTRNGAGAVAVWLFDTNGTINAGFVDQSMTSNFQLLSTKNLNATIGGLSTSPQADKNDDLTWYNTSTGEVSLWTMNGLQTKQRAKTIPIPAPYFVTGVEDVNGDGNADLIWRDEVNSKVGIFLLEGASIKLPKFSDADITGNYYAAGFSDFNGDGATDILWRNRNGSATGDIVADAATVWLMGGGDGTAIKEASFLMNPGVPPFPLDPAQIRRLPSFFQMPGFINTQFAKEDQSTAGISTAKAFNIGTLDGEGNYQDFVVANQGGTAADYFKFKLDKTTISTFDLFTGFGVTTAANAEYQLYKEGAVGTAPTPVTNFTSGGTLAPGVYYIEVKSKASLGTPVNYNLKVKGVPIVVNLKGAGLTVTDVGGAETKVTLTTVVTVPPNTPDDTRADRTTAKLNFKIQNTEISNSGPVKVRFYISRDGVIVDDPRNKSGPADRVIAETTIDNQGVLANSVYSGTIDALLPPGDSSFWSSNDGDYSIGMVIDPVVVDPANTANPLQPGPLLETDETDNFNKGAGFDIDIIRIENIQKPDLLLTSLKTTTPGLTTIAKGGTISLDYTAANLGKKSTGPDLVSLNFYLYRENTDPEIPVEERLLLKPNTPLTRALNTSYLIPPASPTDTIAANSSVNGSLQLTLPGLNDAYWAGLPAGTEFYIGTWIDEGNDFIETDEGNNSNRGKDATTGQDLDRLKVTLSA